MFASKITQFIFPAILLENFFSKSIETWLPTCLRRIYQTLKNVTWCWKYISCWLVSEIILVAKIHFKNLFFWVLLSVFEMIAFVQVKKKYHIMMIKIKVTLIIKLMFYFYFQRTYYECKRKILIKFVVFYS